MGRVVEKEGLVEALGLMLVGRGERGQGSVGRRRIADRVVRIEGGR